VASFVYSLIPFIGGILTFWLGLLVLLKNRKAKVNQTLFGAIICITIWLLATFAMFLSKEDYWAIFWDRVVYAGVVFIPITVYHFGLSFAKRKEGKLLYLGYFLSSLFLILSRTDYFVADLYRYSWSVHTQARFFHHVFLIFFVFYISLFFLNIYQYQRKVKGVERAQANYVLLAFFILAISSLAFLPAYGIDIKFPFLYFTTILCVLILALAIIRYHLFEIRVILTEILVGAMGVLLLIFPFLLPAGYRIFAIGVFLVFCVFAYYLIKATHEEAKRREEAERIAIQERALRESAEKLVKRERKLRLETERLSGARNQFLLSAQHYFRTPLTSLIGLLELMMTGSFGKEKLSQTFQSALELRKRIEEGLDISQFQSGKAILNKEEVQLEDLLLKTIEEFRPQLEQKPNLSFKINLSKEKLAKIKVDIKRIREVFSNLIDNALKHTLKGKVELFLEKIKEKNSILFKVKDTGIGIPKEELSYIGQSPFERGKEAKKLSPMGKGIGLYLSRLIVEAHGGKLWAESEGEGKGSTFYVELPIESEDEKK